VRGSSPAQFEHKADASGSASTLYGLSHRTRCAPASHDRAPRTLRILRRSHRLLKRSTHDELFTSTLKASPPQARMGRKYLVKTRKSSLSARSLSR